MKRYLLCVIILFATLTSNAQITIDSADVVSTGENVIEALDSVAPVAVTIGSPGAGQTWDFSPLQEDQLDTTFFVNVDWLAGYTNFPTANMGMYSTDEDSMWMFISKTATSLDLLGIGRVEPSGDTSYLDFSMKILNFPSAYGNTFIENDGFTIFQDTMNFDPDSTGPHPYVDSIRMTRHVTIDSEMDAWGNVTTPLGTFATLRQYIQEFDVDSIWMYASGAWSLISPTMVGLIGQDSIQYDTVWTYRWWSNDSTVRFNLVEIDYDQPTSAINEITWLKVAPSATYIKANHTDKGYTVYPNPANDVVNFMFSESGVRNIEIIHISGKSVFLKQTGIKNFQVDLTGFAAGSYIYRISDENGNLIDTGKLTRFK